MQDILHANKELYPAITASLSDQSSRRYNESKWTLKELDDWKVSELPNTLLTRLQKEGECYLTSPELILLMDWKLAKGKFRPMLPKLIKSNSAEDVESITKKGILAFLEGIKQYKSADFWDSSSQVCKYINLVKKSMAQLNELKGVGPATSSLILSLLNKITPLAPGFFSDEAFLYYVVDRTRPDSKIKYNIKEYTEEYLTILSQIIMASHKAGETVDFNQLERGGWCLKMIDLHRIDKLADIEIPSEIESFNHYDVDPATLPVITDDSAVSEPKRKKAKVKR